MLNNLILSDASRMDCHIFGDKMQYLPSLKMFQSRIVRYIYILHFDMCFIAIKRFIYFAYTFFPFNNTKYVFMKKEKFAKDNSILY